MVDDSDDIQDFMDDFEFRPIPARSGKAFNTRMEDRRWNEAMEWWISEYP